jgi:hypothetical protein
VGCDRFPPATLQSPVAKVPSDSPNGRWEVHRKPSFRSFCPYAVFPLTPVVGTDATCIMPRIFRSPCGLAALATGLAHLCSHPTKWHSNSKEAVGHRGIENETEYRPPLRTECWKSKQWPTKLAEERLSEGSFHSRHLDSAYSAGSPPTDCGRTGVPRRLLATAAKQS